MKISKTELMIYGAIAIVIIAIILYAYYATNGSYSVVVGLKAVNQSLHLYPYQSTSFKINVNNTGRTAISGLVLTFYVNGVQQNTYNINLPPGTNTQIETNYTYQKSGNFNFFAIADPAHLLNIQNPASAQSNVLISVSAPETANVYTSIPNNGIVSTQSFSLSQTGINYALFLNAKYNLTLFNQFIGGSQKPVIKIYSILSPYMAGLFGAYTKYSNSSVSYIAWIQGTFTANQISPIIASYGYKQKQINENNQNVTYVALSNNTSLCYLYANGWIKLLEYSNSSGQTATCSSVLSTQHPANESITLVNVSNANKNLSHYKSSFVYLNSSTMGSSLIKQNNSVSELNLFSNIYGFFSAYVAKNPTPLSVNALNLTCKGLVAVNGNTNVCSIYTIPKGGGINISYAFINSTEITSNYTLSLYSLVNSTRLLAAHNSAVSLITSLGTNSMSVQWNKFFRNVCAFNGLTSQLPCKLVAYNKTVNNATVNITNDFNGAIRINYASCYISGQRFNVSVNSTLATGNSAQFSLPCTAIRIPGITFQTSYTLTMNFTFIKNRTSENALGILNSTNYAT